jgi:hypothetical protein
MSPLRGLGYGIQFYYNHDIPSGLKPGHQINLVAFFRRLDYFLFFYQEKVNTI